MANKLTDMEIQEISLVDEPANEDARVVIVKAKAGSVTDSPVSMAMIAGAVLAAIEALAPQIVEKAMAEGFSADPDAAMAAASIIKEVVMDAESVTNALEKAEADIVALTKRAEDAEAALKDLQDVIKAKDDEIAKLAAGKPAEGDEEEVLKALPESIRKRLEAAEADARSAREEIQKAKDAAEMAEAIAKAKALQMGDPEKIGGLLLRIRKGATTVADADEIEAVLKSAAEIAAKSPLFKAIGSAAAVDGDPEDLLKAKADEIMKASDGKISFAQAYDKALTDNPALYSAYVAKRRA